MCIDSDIYKNLIIKMQNKSKAYNSNEIVLLRDHRKRIILKIERSQISLLNSLIVKFIETNYKKYGLIYGKDNKTININERLLETEYIYKFVNNLTVFGLIAERNNLKTNDDFVKYVRKNLKKLYDPNGEEFNENYKIIEFTAGKGKRGEVASRKYLEELFYKQYNYNIKIDPPKNSEEDLNGIDGTFMYNDKEVTIQIKPYTKYTKTEESISVESRGALCFQTHYLVLYKEYVRTKKDEITYKYNFICLKNGNNHSNIKGDNGLYITNKKYIIDIS